MIVRGDRGFLGRYLVCHVDGSGDDGVMINAAGRVRGILANQREPATMMVKNLSAAMECFDVARSIGFRRVVNFGSTCAYSPEAGVPFRPEAYMRGDPEATNRGYAWAKRAIFEMGLAFNDECGMDNLYIVMPNLYGPGEKLGEDAHVVTAMASKFVKAIALGDSPVEFFGSGDAEREFLYVEDAARTIPVMVKVIANERRPVHLSGTEVVTMKELARRIGTLAGFNGEIRWDGRNPDGQMRRRLERGWVPDRPTPFDVGLLATIDYCRKEASSHGMQRQKERQALERA